MSNKETNKDNQQHNNPKNDDDPFTLIEKGNSLESSNNRWGSSNYYSRAYSLLLEEYHTIMKTIKDSTSTDVNEPKSNDKIYIQKKKVAALFHDQSVDYLHKARQSLIGALMFEREEDLKRWGDIEPMVDIVHYNNYQRREEVVFDPIMMVLTKEEMERRMDTFRRLFVSSWEKESDDDFHGNSKEKDVVVVHDIQVQTEPMNDETDMDANHEYDQGTTSLEHRLAMLAPINTESNYNNNGDGDEGVNDDIELTLEQRLAKLNSSLTNKSIPKSDDERFENIQSGLNDLGVYVPSNNEKNILDDHSLTDKEQFNLIMNMAKDEAALDMKQTGERDSTDEAIEDLLRRSGIRIDMPLDDEDVDEIVYGENNEDEDVKFSSISSLKKAGFVPDDDDEEESENHEIHDLEDVRSILSKSQQMLLQASICLDECGDMKNFFVSRKKILTTEGDDKVCEQKAMIDDIESYEVKNKDLEESPEKIVDADENDIECENKDDLADPESTNEDKDKLLVQVTENPSNENDVTCHKDSNSSENGDDILDEGDAKEAGQSIKDEVETKEDETNKIAPVDDKETTEEIRIRNLGRDSLVKAKLYLERLLEAWPEDELNKA